VRDAFAALGWDAWSCDLLPTDAPGKHYQTDVTKLLHNNWDLLIAFPPCTYLCSSGMHWTTRGLRPQQLTEDALSFVKTLMDAPVPHIAIENPVGCISTRVRPPDCIVHPWQFGHPESKTTCLWLKNLPKLNPTEVLEKPASGRWSNQTPSGQNNLGPSKDRWKERSKTYHGIAQAMAQQWSAYVLSLPTNARNANVAASFGVSNASSIMQTASVSAPTTQKNLDTKSNTTAMSHGQSENEIFDDAFWG
jgi:hypothetical protein